MSDKLHTFEKNFFYLIKKLELFKESGKHRFASRHDKHGLIRRLILERSIVLGVRKNLKVVVENKERIKSSDCKFLKSIVNSASHSLKEYDTYIDKLVDLIDYLQKNDGGIDFWIKVGLKIHELNAPFEDKK